MSLLNTPGYLEWVMKKPEDVTLFWVMTVTG